MDKIQLVFLAVLAFFGGMLCDKYFGFSFPFFTICFLLITGIIFFATSKKSIDEEE